MVPIIQNDYYKYHAMFKGNYLKGETYLKSLLNAPDTREQIITSVPALAAIFTDFDTNNANRLCYNVLKSKSYFGEAMMNYYKGIELTDHNTTEELFNDIPNTFRILRNKDIDLILKKSNLIGSAIKRVTTLNELRKLDNIDILFDKDVLSVASTTISSSSTNIYSSFTTSWTNNLSGKPTSFDSIETYYDYVNNYQWMKVAENENAIYMPSQIRTRYNNSSTYYYYPCVFKYDIANNTWSLIHICDTETKQTSNSNNGRNCTAVAYDSDNHHLYIFYKAIYNNASVYYDIFDTKTGTVILNKGLVSSVGSSSFQAAYFCEYDETIKAVRYVWKTGEPNISKSSTYGFLYGVTINKAGIDWEGIVCLPAKDYSTPYNANYYCDMSKRENLRYKDGAIIGVYQTSNSGSSASSIFITIKTNGKGMCAKYFTSSYTGAYSTYCAPSNCGMFSNGLAYMKWDNVNMSGSSSRDVYMLIDIGRETPGIVLNKIESTSTSFSFYPSFFFNALLVGETSSSATTYRILGLNQNRNLVNQVDKTNVTSAFNNSQLGYCGSERYRIYLSSATSWSYYDTERGGH